jgi:hypothetical protein
MNPPTSMDMDDMTNVRQTHTHKRGHNWRALSHSHTQHRSPSRVLDPNPPAGWPLHRVGVGRVLLLPSSAQTATPLKDSIPSSLPLPLPHGRRAAPPPRAVGGRGRGRRRLSRTRSRRRQRQGRHGVRGGGAAARQEGRARVAGVGPRVDGRRGGVPIPAPRQPARAAPARRRLRRRHRRHQRHRARDRKVPAFLPPAPFVLFSSAHTPQDVIVNLWWTDLLDARCARIAAAFSFERLIIYSRADRFSVRVL